jgi:hypothetical protein
MEPEYFEVLPRLPELFERFRTFDWSIWEIISTLFAVLGALATVLATYIKWRNSGKRRAKRLTEFLKERDARVATARWDLRGISERPMAAIEQPSVTTEYSRVFPARALRSQINKRGWRHSLWFGSAIERSIRRSQDRLALAKRATETTQHELFLALLTRGAMYDSRGQHEDAFDHFREALRLKPDDLQALEYAGLQLTLAGSAENSIEFLDAVTITSASELDDASIGEFSPEAWRRITLGESPISPLEIRYLTRMLVLSAQKGDDLSLARAHRAIAFSYESLSAPNLLNAVRHAKLAANNYPITAPAREVAECWEQLGCLIYKRSSYYRVAATDALREARAKYRGVRPKHESRRQVERMNHLISRIEDAPQGSDLIPPEASEWPTFGRIFSSLKGGKDPQSGEPTDTV